MVMFAGNTRCVRAPEAEIKGVPHWTSLVSAPGGALCPSSAVMGVSATDSACMAAAGGLTDTAVLACLRAIDIQLSGGAGLAGMAGTRAELIALLDLPTTALLPASESWLRLSLLALLAEADLVQAAEVTKAIPCRKPPFP